MAVSEGGPCTWRQSRLRTSDRLFWVLLSCLWSGWTDAVSMVQPATVIRWQRTGFKLFWKWRSRRNGPGRPAVDRSGRPKVNVDETDGVSSRHRHLLPEAMADPASNTARSAGPPVRPSAAGDAWACGVGMAARRRLDLDGVGLAWRPMRGEPWRTHCGQGMYGLGQSLRS